MMISEENNMATKEAKARADMKFAKEHLIQIKFNLHKTIDADIIEYLDTCPNKQGLIKDLLRQHIAKEKATD